MKKLLLASAFVLATTTLAHAGDDDVWSFGGTIKCSEVLADQKVKPYRDELAMWIMGAWSGANANDQGESTGMVGKDADTREIVKAVISECRKNSKQVLQDAFITTYVRYRELLLAGSDS